MQIILLERVGGLGQMGDVVKVRDGYARNFLLPKKKALRATKDNLAHFERERAQLEAFNLEQKKEAEAVAVKLNGKSFVIIRQASEAGQLYGSVSTRDIADLVTEGGFTIVRSQVQLERPIKTLGQHPVRLQLHPEVSVSVAINVARTQEEAQRMERGEKVTSSRDNFDDEEEEEATDVTDAAEEGAEAAEGEENA
ncbi:MAG: 50S ribosomal protein L9 [Alphaproteobacteria bacterium]